MNVTSFLRNKIIQNGGDPDRGDAERYPHG